MVVCSHKNCDVDVDVCPRGEARAVYFFCDAHYKPCRVLQCYSTRAQKMDLQENCSKYCDAHVCQYPDCCNLRVSIENGTRYCSDHECQYGNCTRIGAIRDHCVEHEKLLYTVGDCTKIAVLPDVPMHWSCVPGCKGGRLNDCMDHPLYKFFSAHTCRVDGCVRGVRYTSSETSLHCVRHSPYIPNPPKEEKKGSRVKRKDGKKDYKGLAFSPG